MSIYYFFKRDKQTYHPVDFQQGNNDVFRQEEIKKEDVSYE